MAEILAELVAAEKVYAGAGQPIGALRGVDFRLAAGDLCVVTGRSGSGKSTLLSLLGALSTPTAGRVELFGQDVATLGDVERSALRAERLGFVFQFAGLLPTLTIYDNVRLSTLFRRTALPRADHQARDLLRQAGLGDRLEAYPDELSGGEQRRVAIARALLGQPAVLLADEPTGDLDSETETEILALLGSLHAAGLTIVLVTHNQDLRARATRCCTMCDGRLTEDEA